MELWICGLDFDKNLMDTGLMKIEPRSAERNLYVEVPTYQIASWNLKCETSAFRLSTVADGMYLFPTRTS